MSLYFFDIGQDALADTSLDAVESRLEKQWDISFNVEDGTSDCLADGVNSSPVNTKEINDCYRDDLPVEDTVLHLSMEYVLNDKILKLNTEWSLLYDVVAVELHLHQEWRVRELSKHLHQDYSVDSSGPNYREIHLSQEYNIVTESFGDELLGYVNNHRANLGLPPIAAGWGEVTEDIAVVHAKNSAAVEISAHDSLSYPVGYQYFTERLGIVQFLDGATFGGENVQTQISSPALLESGLYQSSYLPITAYEVFLAWRNSPGHNAVMLTSWGEGARPIMLFHVVVANDSTYPYLVREYAVQVFIAFNPPNEAEMVTLMLHSEYEVEPAFILKLSQTYNIDAVTTVHSYVDILYGDEVTNYADILYGLEVSGSVDILYGDTIVGYADVLYDDTVEVYGYVDTLYDIKLRNEVINYTDVLYGLEVSGFADILYDNTPIVNGFVDILYDDVPVIHGYADILYDDTVRVHGYVDVLYDDVPVVHGFVDALYDDAAIVHGYVDIVYSLRPVVHGYVDTMYTLFSEVSGYTSVVYDMLSANVVHGHVDVLYNLMPDVVGIAPSMNECYVMVSGVKLIPRDVVISISEDDSLYQARVELGSIDDYYRFTEGVIFTIYLFGETHTFMYDSTSISRDGGNTKAVIEGLSPAMAYADDRVTYTLNVDYDYATTMQAIVEDLLQQTVQWNAPLWPIPAGRVSATDAKPLSLVKELLSSGGLVLDSNLDGSLVVSPKDIVQPPMYSAYAPDHVFDDVLDNISARLRSNFKQGFNEFLITEGSSTYSDVLEWVPDDDNDLQGDIRIYPSPWRTSIALYHTYKDTSLFLGNAKWEEEEIEEREVEFVNGVSVLNYPIKQITSVVWHSEVLGAIMHDAYSRNIETGTSINDGYGLCSIKYITRRFTYRTSVPNHEYLVQYVLKDI